MSYIPDDNCQLLDAQHPACPVFQVEVLENAAPTRQFRVEFDKLALADLYRAQDFWTKYPQVPAGTDGTQFVRSRMNATRLTAVQSLSLRLPNAPKGENLIEIRTRLINPDANTPAGRVQIALLRQTAYLQDPLMLVDAGLKPWKDRRDIYTLQLDDRFRRRNDATLLSVRTLNGRDLMKLIDDAIAAATPAVPASADLKGWDKAVELGIQTALARAQVLLLVEEMKEALRDCGSFDHLDIRGRLVARVRHTASDGEVSSVALKLEDTHGQPPTIAACDALQVGDTLSCYVPLELQDEDVQLTLTAQYTKNAALGGTDQILYDLTYGVLDVEDICESELVGPQGNPPGPYSLIHKFPWRCKNLLA